MDAAFTDIQIVGLDTERTRQSDRAPGLRHMFFALSASPPSVWVQIFQNERQFPRHTMWRRAWIEGPFIVVDCVPDEIEKYHLKDIREDVANANRKYREYLAELDAQGRRKAEAQAAEKKRLDELKSRLKFD